MPPTRRTPIPRDYVAEPLAFGRRNPLAWVMPDGGSEEGLRLAQAQHSVAWAVHGLRDRRASGQIARYGQFSVQTWSDYCLGKAWMTRQAFAAAAVLIASRLPPP